MAKKFYLLAILAIGCTAGPSLTAGTDMVIDNSSQAPPPAYSYAAPPCPVYYVPPPVRVVVYPTYRYYARPVRVFGYGRFYRSHHYCQPRYCY
jgi:hypothetical protein